MALRTVRDGSIILLMLLMRFPYCSIYYFFVVIQVFVEDWIGSIIILGQRLMNFGHFICYYLFLFLF